MKNTSKIATDYLLNLSKEKVFFENDIKDTLSFEDTSIWWWLDDFLLMSDNYMNNMKDIISLKKQKNYIPFKSKLFFRYSRLRSLIRRWSYPYITRKILDKPKILFFSSATWNGEEDPATYPIIDKLKNKYHCLLVDTPPLYRSGFFIKRIKQKFKEKKGIDHSVFELYEPWGISSKVFLSTRFLRYKYKLIKENLLPSLIPQFNSYFKYILKVHLYYYHTLENLLRTEKPTVVFSPTETGFLTKMLCSLCKQYNIPLISRQHGIMYYSTETVHNSDDFPRQTKICVWGKKYKDLLIRCGRYKPEEIIITGNHRYDQLTFGKVLSNRNILWAPSFDKDQETQLLTLSFAAAQNACDLLVKCHPDQKIKFKNHPDNVSFYQKENVFDLIKKSDIVITSYCSGIGLEAMMYNKPIILLQDQKQLLDGDFIKEGVAYRATLDNVESVIHKIFKKDIQRNNRKKYVVNNCYKLDGKAAERIVEVIKDVFKTRIARR